MFNKDRLTLSNMHEAALIEVNLNMNRQKSLRKVKKDNGKQT